MFIIIGLLLIPVVIAIMYKAQLVDTKKKVRIGLNASLPFLAIFFIIACFLVNAEPFQIEIKYSLMYMIFSGDYLIHSMIVFMFSPFMWIIVIYFARILFLKCRIRKNAHIGKNESYLYYRDELDKVSPAIVLFVSTLEIDLQKCAATTILVLKQTGFIKEMNHNFICTKKDTSKLLQSERMILELIRSGNFNAGDYKEQVREEALKQKYLKKNRGGIFLRFIKIIIASSIPFILFAFSLFMDNYVHENYQVYPEIDGYTYFYLNIDSDIEKLYHEVTDQDVYYHRSTLYGEDYNYGEIRADQFQYRIVRKAILFNVISITSMFVVLISIFVCLYRVLEQIIYMNKNYKRTSKGKDLLNKAYALKNYLKDYSLIKDKSEKDLVLWEYYLIYAVALGVNETIEDEVIEKYLNKCFNNK